MTVWLHLHDALKLICYSKNWHYVSECSVASIRCTSTVPQRTVYPIWRYIAIPQELLAEAVGFEPTKPFGLAAFWATGINHSPTLPHGCQMPTIAIQALVGRHEHWHPLSRIIRIVAVGVAQLAAQLAFFGFHNPARQCRLPTWWRERDSNSRYLSVRRVSSAMP